MMNLFRSISLLSAMTLALLTGCMTDSPQRQAANQTLARWEDQRFAPEDSLLNMIKDDDAHVRLSALRSAGLIGQRSVVPAMIKALDDPSETVGRQAAFSLGLMGDAAAVPALEALLATGRSRLHLSAVKALAHLDHQGAGLLKATGFDDPAVVAAAWDGLRNIATEVDSTALADAITDGLNHQQVQVLWRVLRCAERLPSEDLIPQLAPHVRSNIAQVRVHAFRALSQQDHPLALKAVLLGYQQSTPTGDRHQRTMIAACRAFGSLGAHGFFPDSPLTDEDRHLITEALIDAAGQDNPHLAATALAAMQQLANQFELPPEAAGQESLLPVWRIRLGRAAQSHLKRPEPVVRAAAIQSWSALRGSGSEIELHRMLDSATGARDLETILYCLGRQTESSYPILSYYADDKTQEVTVRMAALEALHHLGAGFSPGADQTFVLDKLTQAAADPDFVIAAMAIGYLADFPQRTSLIALIEAWDTTYTEGEAEVKRAILATLKAYGDQLPHLKSAHLPEGMEDRLLTICSTMLRQAFDSSDLRIRLEARETALATGLLPANLIPGEGSLRATLPAFRRSVHQPAVRLPFSAPKVLCTTDKGSFVIQLDGKIAPNTCAMFMDLINRGYYDDLIFHRVVPDFVVQGGDPRGDGWGGPGYTIRSEWSRAPYKRAAVGIAHDGKDTGGSQFFVTLSEQPHLNGRYTVFGEVVEGMEIIDKVETDDHFRLKILP
jgi:cyclophilin family peptidyl-prolyl cis-trans isomerase/HEAT repeat protein